MSPQHPEFFEHVRAWLALSAKKDTATLEEIGLPYPKDLIDWCTAQGFCTHTRDAKVYRFKNIKEIKAWLAGSPLETALVVDAPTTPAAQVLSIFKAWAGVFTHAKIDHGRLYLAAHTATFSAPFEGPDCQADLERFVKAARALPASAKSISPDGAFLVFTEGKTTVKVPVHDTAIGLFRVEEGTPSPWNVPLLPVLATLRPFMVADSVTPWKGAIAFSPDGFATVCTGSVIVQVWTGCVFAVEAFAAARLALMPLPTVDALLSIGKEPTAIVCAEYGSRFTFDDGSTLETGNYAPDFPDLRSVWPDREGLAPVGELPPAVATVRKIATSDLVRISAGEVSDHRLEGLSGELTVTVEGLAGRGFFLNTATLIDVLKIATTIKFCDDGRLYFEGANLRGLVMCGK